MAISYVGVGALFNSTNAGGQVDSVVGSVGDLLLSLAGGKPYTTTITSTNIQVVVLPKSTSGTVANGNGTGSVYSVALYRVATSTANTGHNVTNDGSASPFMALTARFAKSIPGAQWSIAGFTLADTDETGTTVSATGAVQAGAIKSGDWVVVSAVLKDDAYNHEQGAGRSVSIPGCTVGAITWLPLQTTSTGNDGAMYLGYAQITAGTSTAGDATYAATSSVSGAAATAVSLVRLREVVPPDAPTNLTAVGDTDSILVNWDAPAAGVAPDSYNVYRVNPNLLTGDDSTFTNSIGSWGPGLSAPTPVHDPVLDEMTQTAVATTAIDVQSGLIPVSPDALYTATLDVRNIIGSRTSNLRLRFYDSGGTHVSSTAGGATALTSSYTSLTVSAVAPPSATHARLSPLNVTGAAGDKQAFDNARLSLVSAFSVLAPTTQYNDVTTVPSTTYTYYVTAFAEAESSASGTVEAFMVMTVPFAAFGIPL